MLTCSTYGRSYVHDAVKYKLGQLAAKYGGARTQFKMYEPRGKDFYQDGGRKGPDMELIIDGNTTFVDVTAVADAAATNRANFYAARVAASQNKIQLVRTQSEESGKAAKQKNVSPLDDRDQKKMNSSDAQRALQNGAKYVPGTFAHTGGMSYIFKRLLVSAFKQSTAKHGFENDRAITSVLQYASQSIAATIVNARADYVMKNMRKLFKNNGMEEVELRWWRGAQMFNEGYKSSEGQVTAPGFQDALDDLMPSDAVGDDGVEMGV